MIPLITSTERLDIGEALVIPFASLADLIQMKRASVRRKDLIELEFLEALAEE